MQESEFMSVICNYLPQIITVLGTLLGTVLGWLLRYIQDHTGRIEIVIEETKYQKTGNNNYSYKYLVFMCNHSYYTKYLKNIQVVFYWDKENSVTDPSRYSYSDLKFSDISNCHKMNYIQLKYNEPKSFYLCGNYCCYKDISDVKKIELVCTDNNNRKRKIYINTRENTD